MDQNESFLPTLHSVGVPLHFGQRDSAWPCSPDNSCVALFPGTLSFIFFFFRYLNELSSLFLFSTLSNFNVL